MIIFLPNKAMSFFFEKWVNWYPQERIDQGANKINLDYLLIISDSIFSKKSDFSRQSE